MRNIKLTLEYNGARFFGFQRQTGKRTVQSELEKAFRKLFRRKIKIGSASGRTDRGVHAKGQVVHFKVDSDIPLHKIEQALNTYLPEDLSVICAEEMPIDFHARFHVKKKIYRYVIWNSRARSPLKRHNSYHFPYALDINLMKKASKFLIGRHNFRSFAKGSSHSFVRTIYRLTINKVGKEVHFVVEGDGFLYNMVRNIVGTLLLVGTGRLSIARFRQIIKRRDRRHVGPTVPPQGLTLVNVRY